MYDGDTHGLSAWRTTSKSTHHRSIKTLISTCDGNVEIRRVVPAVIEVLQSVKCYSEGRMFCSLLLGNTRETGVQLAWTTIVWIYIVPNHH